MFLQRQCSIEPYYRPQEFSKVFGKFFKTLEHVNSQQGTLNEMETFHLVSIAKKSSRYAS